MIGLGLSSKSLTLSGLESIKSSDLVFLENYTSRLIDFDLQKLKDLVGKDIILADRELVEVNSDKILEQAKEKNVSFLVVGDVFSATTHSALFLDAKKRGINVVVINNASVLTAVGLTGLSLYRFGRVTTLVFPQANYFPTSPYEAIAFNLKNNLHSLVLLDIKNDKLMTINEGLDLLLKLEDKMKENVIYPDTKVVGCARLGSEDCIIKYGELSKLKEFDFGKTPHCIVIPAKTHFIEEEMLSLYKI